MEVTGNGGVRQSPIKSESCLRRGTRPTYLRVSVHPSYELKIAIKLQLYDCDFDEPESHQPQAKGEIWGYQKRHQFQGKGISCCRRVGCPGLHLRCHRIR